MDLTQTYVISTPEERVPFPFQLRTAGYMQGQAKDSYHRTNYKWCIMEYVVSGMGQIEVNGRTFKAQAGDVYILHKGIDHAYHSNGDDPWKKIYFEIDGSLMVDLLSTYQLHKTNFLPQCDLKYGFEQMFQIAKANHSNMHQEAALQFHRMLFSIQEQKGLVHNETSDDLLIIKEFLDSATETKVAMEDIARLVTQSISHVIRRFKKEYNSTPYDYLLSRRIETAKLYLSSTGITVKEIAYRLQFANEYYFSSFFKKKVGESPSAYRNRKK